MINCHDKKMGEIGWKGGKENEETEES